MSRFLNARYQAMKAYVPGEQPKEPNLIKLNTNESPFPPSPLALAAATPEALRRLRLYSPIGVTELDCAIADAYGLSPERVIAGNGSDEILSYAFLAWGDRGARYPDITYGFYRVWAALYGVRSQMAPVAGDFSIDPDDYRDGDEMVVIANPNAPTGLTLCRADVERIVRLKPDRPVVVDEAYVDFGGESAASLVDRYDNLLVVMTASKSRSLAGARLGWALGSKALIEDLNKMRYSLNPYNVNAITQLMGAAALRDRAYFEDCVRRIVDARAYTEASLRALGFAVLPSKANFVFASPPDGDARGYQAKLRAKGILIRHFDQPRIEAYARISIGRMDEMERLIEVTKEVYA